MVTYTCNKCLKNFNKKSHYLQHVEQKKKPCQIIEENRLKNESKKIQFESERIQFESEKIQFESASLKNENICEFCKKNFSTSSNLYRHINNRCKVKKLEDEKKQNIFENLIEKDNKMDIIIQKFDALTENNKHLLELTETLKKQNEQLNMKNDELYNKNDELNKKIDEVLRKNNKSIINTTNNTNNTQNITTNINIVPYKINPFGKETFKKLDKKEVLKIMTDTDNNGKFCFNRLIELIHFNNKLPENQNIYMNDYNRGLYMIHDGKDWNLRKDEEFIIFSVLEHVRDLYNEYNDEELEAKLESDPKFNRSFTSTFKKYFDYVYDEIDDKELDEKELKKKNEFKEMMNKEVKNKLYNKRKLPKENYDKLKCIIDSNNFNNLLK